MDRNIKVCSVVLFRVKSLSARRAWIEISVLACSVGFAWSLSARRAWIEIVDPDKDTLTDDVALRKESVDRNVFCGPQGSGKTVALRKESVDRNRLSWHLDGVYFGSLSARRAWIEIPACVVGA